MYPADTSLW